MADVTGGPVVTNASPFAVPADLTALKDHFGSATMFSVANAAALPASGNWLGRLLMAEDTGTLYECTALPGTWTVVYAEPEAPTACTYGTGWSTSGGLSQNVARVDRVGNRVFLSGIIISGAGFGYSTVLTVPTQFRPPNGGTRTIGSGVTSGGIAYELSITNGVIGLVSGYASASIPQGQNHPLGGMSWVLD